MTYSNPAATSTADLAKTVADEGWSVVGVLDRPLSRRLLGAVDEVASGQRPDGPGHAAALARPAAGDRQGRRLPHRRGVPDDGALEVVPGRHLDTTSRYPTEEQPAGVSILGPAGTVAVFDARLWHCRRDNLGRRIRRAMFMAYS